MLEQMHYRTDDSMGITGTTRKSGAWWVDSPQTATSRGLRIRCGAVERGHALATRSCLSVFELLGYDPDEDAERGLRAMI